MNMILFRPWPVEHKAISSVLRYARPRFHRLFCRSRLAPDEHDDAFRSDPAGWLPMNTTRTLFLRSEPAMYTSPGRTYARVGIRDPARMYICGRIFFLAPWPLYVRVHATCAPLLRHVRVYIDTCPSLLGHGSSLQPANRSIVCTYTLATRMTTLHTLRPGGSRLLGTSLCVKM